MLPMPTDRCVECVARIRALQDKAAGKGVTPKEWASLRDAQRELLALTRPPLTTFRGTLKRVSPTDVGPKASATLREAFPNFDGTKERARLRDEVLKRFGVDPHPFPTFNEIRKASAGDDAVVHLVDRQFRRFSGDLDLPPGCYASVCRDASGKDDQTLCRELYEYKDLAIPGEVFVSDGHDRDIARYIALHGARPSQLLRGDLILMVMPPLDPAHHAAYRHFYSGILSACYGPYESASARWDGITIVTIPVRADDVEIEDVLDLREVAARRWFFEFFRDGDGAVFTKTAARQIESFEEMLPALVHPEYGGCGFTKSVGSWMRVAGVAGLVYPSARSDVSIDVDVRGVVRSFRGWNFVDYRAAYRLPDARIHSDVNDWPDFVGGRQAAPALIRRGDSWEIKGQEARWRAERDVILKAFQSPGRA